METVHKPTTSTWFASATFGLSKKFCGASEKKWLGFYITVKHLLLSYVGKGKKHICNVSITQTMSLSTLCREMSSGD